MIDLLELRSAFIEALAGHGVDSIFARIALPARMVTQRKALAHPLHPAQSGSLQPSVPCDDRLAPVDDDWIIKAEFVNAIGNLPGLTFAVGPSVPRMGSQRSDRLIGNS